VPIGRSNPTGTYKTYLGSCRYATVLRGCVAQNAAYIPLLARLVEQRSSPAVEIPHACTNPVTSVLKCAPAGTGAAVELQHTVPSERSAQTWR
jgi:hypothetical protein